MPHSVLRSTAARFASPFLGALPLLAALAPPLSAAAVASTSPASPLDVPTFAARAELDARPLVVGETSVLRVLLDVDAGIHREFAWEDPRKPGELRRPILQIQTPASVELLGAAPTNLVTPGDFQQSYLRFPYGRRLLDTQTEIAFRLIAPPELGDTLGLNVVTYLEGDEPGEAIFVRLRIDLPLTPGASATGMPGATSRWAGDDTLSIGDTAPGFSLKDARTAKTVSLESVLGQKRALVMAYRRST